jgi:polar amino acid transport system substrate-binding protein
MNLRIYLTVFLLATLFSQPESYAADKKLSLAAAEYQPYYGEHLPNYGPVTEIIVKAFNKVNYEVSVSFYPWLRGEILAKEGVHDGMIPPWRTKAREAYFAFSEPLFPNELYFYKHKNTHAVFSKQSDLKAYKIGTVRGYANPDWFAEEGLTLEEVSLDLHNLTKLAVGRIDLVLIDKKVAEFLINTEIPEHKNNLERIEPALESRMQYLTLSKKTDNYTKKLADFNKGLKLLKASGEYDKILSKLDL